MTYALALLDAVMGMMLLGLVCLIILGFLTWEGDDDV